MTYVKLEPLKKLKHLKKGKHFFFFRATTIKTHKILHSVAKKASSCFSQLSLESMIIYLSAIHIVLGTFDMMNFV